MFVSLQGQDRTWSGHGSIYTTALINVSYGKPENPVTYFENDTKCIYLLVTMIFLNYICFASLFNNECLACSMIRDYVND